MDAIFNIAGQAMTAQSMRLNAVASNLANAESTVSSTGQTYRAKQVVFTPVPIAGEAVQGVRVARVVEDQSPLRRAYDPKHPAADAQGFVSFPNVNVVDEMVNMISASRSFQTSVELMNTAKQLALRTLSIGQ
ncbi:MAG: flagellar basal body rod protein FlgC [Gammaproteobacteria bacterium]|nr:flagellar basal body rod protein FlgC [Gammaproteobacteria bacterium]